MNMLLAVLILSAGVPMLAQVNPLSYRPIAADYSTTLERIVMVSASPNVLHVYNPATAADQTVALSRAPLSLSLSLDGRFAAVGHDGAVSYVNLQTPALEKTLTVALNVQQLVLGNDTVYVIPGVGPISLLRISTGAVTAGGEFVSNVPRLHPSGNFIYSAAGSIFSRYDLSTTTRRSSGFLWRHALRWPYPGMASESIRAAGT